MRNTPPSLLAGRPVASSSGDRPPASHKARAPRNRFTALSAENAALRVRCDAMYTLLVKCRDWFVIMGAEPAKISELDGMIRRVRKILL
jgi:hypothetical protein